MALDLLVPPIMMLLFVTLGGLFFSSILFIAGGSAVPVLLILLGLSALASMLLWVRNRYARDILGLEDILALPMLVLDKLSFYSGLWSNRRGGWIRTDRK